MADDADIANDFIDNAVSKTLSMRQNSMLNQVGSKVCKLCQEEIPDVRRELGFHLCVPCAEETEQRKALFINY